MQTSMNLLLMGAVAQNFSLYSSGYAAAMEEHSPLSFSYMQEHSEDFIPYNGLLLKSIETLAFNEYLLD
jgi:hypothetical protein